MPAAIRSEASETCQLAASVRPTRPPSTTATVAIRNAHRGDLPHHGNHRDHAVRCANGPRSLSGPRVTKKIVKISAGPIIRRSRLQSVRWSIRVGRSGRDRRILLEALLELGHDVHGRLAIHELRSPVAAYYSFGSVMSRMPSAIQA
jgi:hypothetical protein